ncbi:hypothetical protein VM1G_09816 [Cytospora mali]|uniref:Uncharacterized protein n=1 Tax=Cytospora mali TaxID=578113 RepID=A0A194WE05_CYTMA|nr:hypothetical protein VM1G_09816 [Valsa mali]
MSPIIARAAIRATRAAAQRQQAQFSVMRTMRNVARSFEPHPFQRLPIANSTQAADWTRAFKRVGGQAVLYAAAWPVILGWPYFAAMALDGHIGSL